MLSKIAFYVIVIKFTLNKKYTPVFTLFDKCTRKRLPFTLQYTLAFTC